MLDTTFHFSIKAGFLIILVLAIASIRPLPEEKNQCHPKSHHGAGVITMAG
jgi:hypothetical protein